MSSLWDFGLPSVNETVAVSLVNRSQISLADFTGIDVEAVNQLRNKLREADVQYQVIKNRLAIRAADEVGIAGLKEHFTGPTAIAYSNEDPVGPAKILQDFADDGGKMIVKSGYMDGKILAADEVVAAITTAGGKAYALQANVSVESEVDGLIKAVIRRDLIFFRRRKWDVGRLQYSHGQDWDISWIGRTNILGEQNSREFNFGVGREVQVGNDHVTQHVIQLCNGSKVQMPRQRRQGHIERSALSGDGDGVDIAKVSSPINSVVRFWNHHGYRFFCRCRRG